MNFCQFTVFLQPLIFSGSCCELTQCEEKHTAGKILVLLWDVKKNQDTSMILSLNFRHNFNCQSSILEPIYLHRVDVVLRAANHTCGPVQTGRGLKGDCEVVGLWYVLHCGGAGVGLHDGRKLKRQDQRKQLLWERTGGETVFIRVELKKKETDEEFSLNRHRLPYGLASHCAIIPTRWGNNTEVEEL